MVGTCLPKSQSVDKPCYTRAQARNGGILSGASRRFQVRNRHAQVRALSSAGLSRSQIAAEVGYHVSTVGRILTGAIGTCLTRAETLASGVLPRVVHELTHVQKVLSTSPSTVALKPVLKRKKPRWNFFRGKWAAYFRRKHGDDVPDTPVKAPSNIWWYGPKPYPPDICECSLRIIWGQCCPCCGRYHEHAKEGC